MNIPSKLDISPSDGLDLDEKSAIKNFLGKSIHQAVQLFNENAFAYLEDMFWMGPRAFEFYYLAFSEYLRLSKIYNPDVIERYVWLIKRRLEKDNLSIEVRKVIYIDCGYCVDNFDEYRINGGVIGDVLNDLKRIRESLEKNSGNQ